ncbi:phosphotransferase enzyme family protein [Anaerosporobacter sp.]|uniref:phosphotransferase enzyme family protein n=1 Tax=Anaerosporobacter sp. TaxID=1872529 RepID=UPI00286EF329|nr:phosphotransferase [Anaerosporobacter sp.]
MADKNSNYENLLEEAMKLYNFTEPKVEFIRHNENITYSIIDRDKKYLLRIHKEAKGLDFSFYRGDINREILIKSEIDLLNKLSKEKNIVVQTPVQNKNGKYVSCLEDGSFVTVLTWLDGERLDSVEITKELAFKMGEMTARLHESYYTLPTFKRCVYDDVFIDKFIMEAKSAMELKHIKEVHYLEIRRVLKRLQDVLIKEKDNFVIIHYDFSKSNIIYSKESVSPIDFSMFGYGIREMDLGGYLCMIEDSQLISSILEGYESVSGYKINK